MTYLHFDINGLSISLAYSDDLPVLIAQLGIGGSSSGEKPNLNQSQWARLVELQASGFNHNDHHGNKYTGTNPGGLLRYSSYVERTVALGTKLEIQQIGGGLRVTSHWQFLADLPTFRSWTVVENIDSPPLLLEYVSTFALAHINQDTGHRWDDFTRLHIADNAWCGECQWRSGPLREFGFEQLYSPGSPIGFSLYRVSISNQGSWSTLGFLPMGALENTKTKTTLFWQIEHNGSWQWEVGDIERHLYLRVAGPTYREGHWSRELQMGEGFTSVTATIGLTPGNLESALRILTRARRLYRRDHPDMKALPVIFNDYMNCLMGDPTTAKLLPIIKCAASIGCEYFVVDAGWYAELGKSWWGTVGHWIESRSRFPGGLSEVMDSIRKEGMIPGLWLEVEVVGVECTLAKEMPDDWFFQRQGRRLIDHGRYQLDFRHPAVRQHADTIVDRLIGEYAIGYIKMDYNINSGPGTDVQTDAPGHGLLEHNRAYLSWVESVLDRYPNLVIENCSSGGLRMDYASLAVHSIQSTSDQMDYRLNAVIAAASASAVTPEQSAVWSYPLKDADAEETILNMVNSLLLRIHQSGAIHELSEDRLDLVAEAIGLYKNLRTEIPNSLPFWPLGLPHLGDGWISFGLDMVDKAYLAIWRLGDHEADKCISLPQFAGPNIQITCLYPASINTKFRWSPASGDLAVTLPAHNSARLFAIEQFPSPRARKPPASWTTSVQA